MIKDLRVRFQSAPSANRDGFTLVEMLVVAPIAILVIGGLIAAMVSLTGDTLLSNTRAGTTYRVQSAINRIEEDAKISTNFMQTFSYVSAPQGKDGNTSSFDTSSDDIIFTQQATTASPYDTSRQSVYYANQPNACGSADVGANRPLLLRVIYFQTDNGDGTSTLWRRQVVRDWNQSGSPDANTTCAAPWQRDSCPVGSTLNGTPCQSYDEKILTSVTNLAVNYYTPAGTSTSDPRQAEKISVSITIAGRAAGNTITETASTQVTRINNLPIATSIPDTPMVTATVEGGDTATFSWPKVFGAEMYTVTYSVNGGAYQMGANKSLSTTFSRAAERGQSVCATVYANNEVGTSPFGYACTSIPLWNTPDLQNGWVNYDGGYQSVGYTKTSTGLVILKGLLTKNGGAYTVGETIFTLPPNFRPANEGGLMFATMKSGTSASRVEVWPDGRVIAANMSTSWTSLDGVKFLAASGGYTWQTPTFANGWANYGGSWVQAGYTKDSSGRVFTRGLVKSGTTTDNTRIIGTAAGYASAEYLHLASAANDSFTSLSASAAANEIQAKGVALNAYVSLQEMFYSTTPDTTYGGWHAMGTLQNGWVAYPGYATPSYIKAADGVVTLKGLIRNGTTTSGTVIYTLPAGYRPARTILGLASCVNAACRFDVTSTGDILIREGANSGWSALDSISFMAEQ